MNYIDATEKREPKIRFTHIWLRGENKWITTTATPYEYETVVKIAEGIYLAYDAALFVFKGVEE